MRRNALFLAPVLFAAAVATAQQPQVKTFADLPTHLATIKANVAKIAEPAEKARWQANIDAWNIELGLLAAVPTTDAQKLQGAVEQMKTNVAEIKAPAEKQRWTSNVALWELAIAGKGSIRKPDAAAARGLVSTISKNVGKIKEAGEKERWTANLAMWRIIVARPAVAAH